MIYKFEVQPIENVGLNIKGWRIVRSDGYEMRPFTQKREAEKLVDFFTKLSPASPSSNAGA